MITPAQCRAARALLKISQAELAEIAGCHLSTVQIFESEKRAVMPVLAELMQASLEANGITFAPGSVAQNAQPAS
jgi:transcriptional regulator with XRE-family HTH domain